MSLFFHIRWTVFAVISVGPIQSSRALNISCSGGQSAKSPDDVMIAGAPYFTSSLSLIATGGLYRASIILAWFVDVVDVPDDPDDGFDLVDVDLAPGLVVPKVS